MSKVKSNVKTKKEVKTKNVKEEKVKKVKPSVNKEKTLIKPTVKEVKVEIKPIVKDEKVETLDIKSEEKVEPKKNELELKEETNLEKSSDNQNANKGDADVIFCIINRGFNDLVMNAARAAGARGGTVIHARGTGNKDFEKFYGISVSPEKEIVIIAVSRDITDKVLLTINKEAGLDTAGQGIAFALPVREYSGFSFNNLNKDDKNANSGDK